MGFLVVPQWFAAPNPVFRYLIPAYILFLAAVGSYNFYFLNKLGQVNLWMWMRPLLFLTAWFGLYLLAPNVFLRGIFLVVSLLLIYLFELNLGNVGENILFNQVVLSAFAFFTTIAAASYYFIGSPSIVFILLICAYTILLTRASLEMVPTDFQTKWLYAFLLGLFTTQVFWTASFLPLHFSAIGFFVLAVFYFIWILCHHYLFNNLTVKKIQFNAMLLITILILILISTPWSILVS